MTRSWKAIVHRIAAVVFMATLVGCGKEGAKQQEVAPEVSVLTLQNKDLSVPREFVGQTKGAVDAEIRARVEGIIQGVHFKEGSEVKEGDLLYSIDPAPIQAKVAEAKAKVAEAETRLAKADADVGRLKPLAAMRAVSQRDLDAAVAQQGVAKSSVDAANAALEAANIELGYTKVTAPIAGLIGLTKAKAGEYVGRPPNPVVLTTISQLDPINVRFSVTERDYLYFSRLRQKSAEDGQKPAPFVLTLELSDGSIHSEKGKVASVDSQIDPTTGTLTVEATFPNPQKLLRAGQFAKIRTVGETVTGVVAVPKKAIRDLQGIKQVAVVTADDTIDVRTIKVGREVGDDVEVTEGLGEGDRIVPEAQARLKTGTKVTVR
jgi:membrane fusion protein (multidrug efflux system)